jgi:serine/threonine protein kinase
MGTVFPVASLGHGASGVVQKIRIPETGEFLASKIISRSSDGTSRIADQEIRACNSLSHLSPHILPLYDVVPLPLTGQIALCFPFFEYDLRRVIPCDGLPLCSSISYLHQILSGLDAIHRAGWIHRDLKPSNILVSSRNFVVVADLGCARPISEADQTHGSGTIGFEAPEVVLNSASVGPSSDIWAVGCILFEMLTGRRLFRPGNSKASEIGVIVDRKGVPSPSDFPEFFEWNFGSRPPKRHCSFEAFLDAELPADARCLKRLLMRMLEWKPSARVSAAEALKDEVFADVVDYKNLPPLSIPEQSPALDTRSKRHRSELLLDILSTGILERVVPPAIRVC